MAFSEAERVQIRRWLGAQATYLITYPALEDAITVVQSVEDGGQRADASTEVAIRDHLAKLAAIAAQLDEYIVQMQAVAAEQVKVDPLRGMAGLRRLGRQYVGHISDALNMKPLRDVFQGPRTSDW